jgi:penicillin-binding protein 1A
MGITTELENVVSMPLGTEEVLPVDMAGALASIANDGLHAEPYYIDRVEDQDGRTIFRHQPEVERAASAQSARLGTEVLEANVRSGTGTRARIPGQHAAGKTGTGQESSDAWFVGFTPYLSTAVWLGSPDDNDPVRIRGRGITGGSYPAEIWGRYMRAWHEGLPERDYPAPAGTRAGRYLELSVLIDLGGRGAPTTTSPFPPSVPDLTLPPQIIDRFPDGFPVPGGGGGGGDGGGGGTTGGPEPPPDPRFPPGFPFDDAEPPGPSP